MPVVAFGVILERLTPFAVFEGVKSILVNGLIVVERPTVQVT